MIQGNINAFGIIGTLLLTVIAILRYGDRSKSMKLSFKRIIFSLVISLALCIINIILSTHMCGAGNPFFQWLIPAICLFIIMVVVNNKKVKILLSIILVIISLVLCQQFIGLVHSDSYIGNPSWLDRRKTISSHALERERSNGEKMSDEERQRHIKTHSATTYSFWHTFITGLYGVKYDQ